MPFFELEAASSKAARSVTALGPRGYEDLAGGGQAHQDDTFIQQQQQQRAAAACDWRPPPPALPPPGIADALRLSAWLALLWAGYGFQRGLCAAGLPYDCDTPEASAIFSALTCLAFVGAALAAATGATAPARFAWLFSWRRAYVWLAYAAVLPCYSGLSNLPALQASLASTHSWGAGMIAAFALAGLVALAALAFHIRLAWQAGGSCSCPAALATTSGGSLPGASSSGSLGGDAEAPPVEPGSPEWQIGTGNGQASTLHLAPPDGAATVDPKHRSIAGAGVGAGSGGRRARWRSLSCYLAPRLAALAYFAVWFGVAPATGAASLHLHHYALGLAAAAFATFNHPVSGLLLAIGTAVFVQGIGAYGFDPLLSPAAARRSGGCLPVSSNATGQMVCAFWGAQPFNLSFCTDQPTIPWFDCSVPWPWAETALLPRSFP